MNKFEITFDVPSHGWLPVHLRIGSERFEFAASDVLNDPVTEIANACVQLLSGSLTSTTNWWLEPAWHTLKFEKQPSNPDLNVTFGYLADEHACNPESEHQITVNIIDFCRVIAASLDSLIESTGRDEYISDSGWGKPFPDNKMKLLYQMMTEPNGT